jgi:hypothetical protein
MGTKFSKTGGREEEEGEPPPNLRHEDAQYTLSDATLCDVDVV